MILKQTKKKKPLQNRTKRDNYCVTYTLCSMELITVYVGYFLFFCESIILFSWSLSASIYLYAYTQMKYFQMGKQYFQQLFSPSLPKFQTCRMNKQHFLPHLFKWTTAFLLGIAFQIVYHKTKSKLNEWREFAFMCLTYSCSGSGFGPIFVSVLFGFSAGDVATMA